ncbi:hypothetical protein EBN88_15530 [Streptomyces triticirhizae]|uniref:Uncharacterized protein n=1 Tax=Streptomyces triticirhizae TaxID=2483353 RepID=A0A3M2LP29_9ACTN|nr:hypothetical protein EBN88_15530 [Streptomyces triticirhizae]
MPPCRPGHPARPRAGRRPGAAAPAAVRSARRARFASRAGRPRASRSPPPQPRGSHRVTSSRNSFSPTRIASGTRPTSW